MNNIDKIELRNEKVRKIIGDMPSGFIRYGISIITCILITIYIVLYFIPYKNVLNTTKYLLNL